MELLTPTKEIIQYLVCIHCKAPEAFNVTWHLQQKPLTVYGPWACDGCGKSQVLTLLHNGQFSVEPHAKKILHTLDLLSFENEGNETIYVVVKGIRVSNKDGTYDMDASYLYEEHTCPTNFTREILGFIKNGDDDPHGLFTFIKGVPDTRKKKDEFDVREMQKLFEMDLGFPVDEDEEEEL